MTKSMRQLAGVASGGACAARTGLPAGRDARYTSWLTTQPSRFSRTWSLGLPKRRWAPASSFSCTRRVALRSSRGTYCSKDRPTPSTRQLRRSLNPSSSRIRPAASRLATGVITFFETTSFRAWLWQERSATRALRRGTSKTSMPPYFERHWQNVTSEILCLRHSDLPSSYRAVDYIWITMRLRSSHRSVRAWSFSGVVNCSCCVHSSTGPTRR